MPRKNQKNLLSGVKINTQIEPRSTNQATYLESMQRNTFTFGVGRAGTGKCFERGTRIRMYDGSAKKVEEIQNGEYVMGDDSTPRLVYGTTSGDEDMFSIIPNKGEPWAVNASHILVLVHTITNQIVEISVRDYLTKSKRWKQDHKMFRVPVHYDRMSVTIDPYYMGLWIGDGNWSSPTITNIDSEIIEYVREYAQQRGMTTVLHNPLNRCQFINIKEITPINHGGRIGILNTLKEDFKSYGLMIQKEKSIPKEYLINDRQTRLELLAGLIDSDGSLSSNGFEITTKYIKLGHDIQDLALSLGFWASINSKWVEDKLYHRIFISGETDEIPTKLSRKQASPRLQKKNVRRFSFDIVPKGQGKYYGFAVDGNHRFLLADFTVTHNTLLAVWQGILELLSSKNKINRIVVIRPVIGNKFGESIGALPGNIAEKMIPYGSSVLDNLKAFLDKESIEKLLEHEYIEFVPLTLLRGRSLNNAFVIVEEAQNIKESSKGVYMVMSRLGLGSKMVFNGDLGQSDLQDDDSALRKAVEILIDPAKPPICGLGVVELYDREDVQRHPLLFSIMERFGETDDDPF